ncbi:ATP-dependent helicase [Pseudoalteromonas sp. S201]|uniref:DEAD/DEAH box helicase n=1 Tax=unclassified Pseudoalteromonas TaxID=194690 RepID=UPI00110CEEE4|nr:MULTISPECIES: DEAD/DEAH box helicase [unclassified Pseudoalteromonas]TMS61169.1 ATP-dependent helicase [Pseudoalteromonas sp. S3173]TMS91963.1 ATP-dependent helicase [Pseudoalteromonas sp. S201]
MPNLMHFEYAQSGASSNTNDMGMRAMQSRAFEARNSQYLLLKAPPASGKSRALMFLALDKLHNQGIKKAIVAVPERSIGGSFDSTALSKYGFFCDWDVENNNNLCTPGGEASKTKAFKRFIAGDDQILICTHATLRFAFQEIEDSAFNDCLIAIDEFHHVSADGDNVLGDVLRSIMANTNAHIVAMTGSYFRGDSIPVLTPEDEAQFDKVSFNYYEQLNGYKYLKSLGIGYHFYQGRYTDVIHEVLNSEENYGKKTIIHIPNVNSGESTKEKYDEVDAILEVLGDARPRDPETGVITVERPDGTLIKVADLVEENNRDVIQNYLRNIKSVDDMDVIIALGMAKEGFDWEYCEHALTIGYRSSLTEIIQIIGRCTRDSSNKTHAQFTNLIAQPDAENEQVTVAVNNMLKAITCSLLMEQVLAPNFKFKAKKDNDFEPTPPGTMKIGGFKEPSTKRTKDIIESDLADLKAAILQDDKVIAASAGKVDPEVVNKILIPKIIQRKYPDLTEAEIEEVRQQVVVDSAISSAEVTEQGGKKFVRMADKFINIDDLHIDLIDEINPFQKAFEILSKSVTTDVLKLIQESIETTRIQMDFEEAKLLWPKVKVFVHEHGREPDLNASDFNEKRLAECLIYIKQEKRKRMQA